VPTVVAPDAPSLGVAASAAPDERPQRHARSAIDARPAPLAASVHERRQHGERPRKAPALRRQRSART